MRALTIAGCLLAATAPAGAAELVVNGDFEAGNAGFTSGYTYAAPAANALQTPGSYTVARNARSVNPGFTSFGDQASGTGLYLIANGATAANGLVWTQSIDVVAGAEYKFKGYIAAASTTNRTTIDVMVSHNGGPSEFLGRFTPPTMVGDWLGIEAGFRATANRLTLQIFDRTAGSNGNDFALDTLRLVGPAVAAVPGVPEPGVWLMMITGFGLAGTAMRRRRVIAG